MLYGRTFHFGGIFEKRNGSQNQNMEQDRRGAVGRLGGGRGWVGDNSDPLFGGG